MDSHCCLNSCSSSKRSSCAPNASSQILLACSMLTRVPFLLFCLNKASKLRCKGSSLFLKALLSPFLHFLSAYPSHLPSALTLSSSSSSPFSIFVRFRFNASSSSFLSGFLYDIIGITYPHSKQLSIGSWMKIRRFRCLTSAELQARRGHRCYGTSVNL